MGEAMDQEKKRVELYENKSQTVSAAIDKIAVDLISIIADAPLNWNHSARLLSYIINRMPSKRIY